MGVFLLLVGVPVLLAVVFGLFAFKGVRPMIYRCARCGHQFSRPAHRGYPDTCPACAAHDWHLPG
jgi:hypothetical protein